jgi:hypothetical protein
MTATRFRLLTMSNALLVVVVGLLSPSGVRLEADQNLREPAPTDGD